MRISGIHVPIGKNYTPEKVIFVISYHNYELPKPWWSRQTPRRTLRIAQVPRFANSPISSLQSLFGACECRYFIDPSRIQKTTKNILAISETSGADALAGFTCVFA